MENVYAVIAERDRAFHLLETGETGEPGERRAVNQLGLHFRRRCQEHYVPLAYSRKMRLYTRFNGPWQDRYKRLMRERMMLRAQRHEARWKRKGEEREDAFLPKAAEEG